MLFYIVGPFLVTGMSWKEPFIALFVCGIWGVFGGIYFQYKLNEINQLKQALRYRSVTQ